MNKAGSFAKFILLISSCFLALSINISYAGNNDSSLILSPPRVTDDSVQKANSTVTNVYRGDPVADSVSGVLKPCPATISGCPDINGHYPAGGSQATCPTYCYVSSQITVNPADTGDANLKLFVPHVTHFSVPKCPTGYFAGATFSVAGKDSTNYVWGSPPAISPVTSEVYTSIQNYNTANPANLINCSARGAVGSSPVIAGSCPGSCAIGSTPGAGNALCVPAENNNMIYLNQCVSDGHGNHNYSYRQMACTPLSGFYSASVLNPAFTAPTYTSQVCTLSTTSWD